MTPLANLSQTLTADLIKIWDSLAKPAELWDHKLEDYFDLSFTTLPHKVCAIVGTQASAMYSLHNVHSFWQQISFSRRSVSYRSDS